MSSLLPTKKFSPSEYTMPSKFKLMQSWCIFSLHGHTKVLRITCWNKFLFVFLKCWKAIIQINLVLYIFSHIRFWNFIILQFEQLLFILKVSSLQLSLKDIQLSFIKITLHIHMVSYSIHRMLTVCWMLFWFII